MIILQEWVLCFRTKKYSVCFLKLMLEVEKRIEYLEEKKKKNSILENMVQRCYVGGVLACPQSGSTTVST